MPRYVRSRNGAGSHFYQTSAPTVLEGAKIGDLWSDTDASPVALFLCTSVSPVTWSTIAGGGDTITLSGDVSGSGTTSITTTIGAGKVTNAMLAGSIASSKLVGTDIATVGTITSGTWNGTTVGVTNGGTGNTSFTAYSLIAAGTTGTGAFQNISGLGTSGYVLTSNGSGALPTWKANIQSLRPTSTVFHDYSYSAVTSENTLISSQSGTGAGTTFGATTTTDGTRIGMATLSTGTTTTGVAMSTLGGTSDPLYPGSGAVTMEAAIYIPNLSDGTDRYQYWFTIQNAPPAVAPPTASTDLAHWFLYSDNINSGNWQAISSTGAGNSTINSNVAVTAGSWIRLTMVINATNTSIEFFVNGTSIGTNTTFLPSGSGFSIRHGILKSAGTTARTIIADYLYRNKEFTTLR